MGIERIEIENYKSIKKCTLNLKQLNLIIGENGCGKTNVISAIQYFYENMLGKNDKEEEIYDQNNRFSNEIRIGITYDCRVLKKIITRKLKDIQDENSSYYQKVNSLIDSKKEIYLELKKIKNMPIRWNIKEYWAREIIYHYFPCYFVEPRNIDAESWELIWQNIGDFLKLEKSTEDGLQEQMFENVKANRKVASKFKQLQEVFEHSEIQLKKYTPKKYASSLTKLYFGGENFQISQHAPKFFSDGTNSFNYISLLIEIIQLIGEKKIKFPVVIIDEPEISLHHKYIDKLCENMIESYKNQYILATHSSRLLKNILRNSPNSSVIHLKNSGKYTNFSYLKPFDDKRQNSVIHDEHANSYFANMLLLVEGETELQLFYNPLLQEIFPILKKMDIIKAASDRVVQEGILPDKRNYRIPYLILIDMDKIIAPQMAEGKFVVNKKQGYFIERKQEKYVYGEKRQKTYYLQKEIRRMLEENKFVARLPLYSCTDSNFYELKQKIRQYFLQYHTFVNFTTIEGVLVNLENETMFLQYFFKTKNPTLELQEYLLKIHKKDRVNLLRLLVEGQSDFMVKLKQISQSDAMQKILKENKMVAKTSGWVSEWILYYLCDVLNVEFNHMAEQKIKILLKEGRNKEACRNAFTEDFIELYEIINEISKRDRY